jgi:hypothetical protein
MNRNNKHYSEDIWECNNNYFLMFFISKEVFNNFWWFNIVMISSEEWNDLGEKAWEKNYQALYHSNFRWRAS